MPTTEQQSFCVRNGCLPRNDVVTPDLLAALWGIAASRRRLWAGWLDRLITGRLAFVPPLAPVPVRTPPPPPAGANSAFSDR